MLQKFSGAETLDFSLRGYLGISCIELLQPSIKSLCNKTFKLNPVFCSNDTSTPGATVRAISEQDYSNQYFRLAIGLLIGTIPIAVASLLLKKSLNVCNSPFRALIVVGISSIMMSLLLGIAERFGKRNRVFSQLSLSDGIWVGICQSLALIPGVSRSGSTLTAGLFLGMERETAARFSFLLGLPAVFLAGALELHTLFKAGLDVNGWITLIIGLTTASISAFAAIYSLLHYLEKYSTWVFVWYRLAMGIFLVVSVVTGFLPN